MHRRISFDQWSKAFQVQLESNNEAKLVIRRLEGAGVPIGRLLVPLWVYCCTPSKKELQEALLASDHQVAALRRMVRDTAHQIELLNEKMAAVMFLGFSQKPGVLPGYQLSWDANLRDVPRLFKISPELLRLYAHTLGIGRDFLKKAIAHRPILRGRILQILYFAAREHDSRTSPFTHLATVLGAAFLAAGDTKTEIGEANLQRQFSRFKAEHPQDSKSAELMAVLVKDMPNHWFELLLPYLVTAGLIHRLVPV